MLVVITAAAARALLWPRLAGPWLTGGPLDLKAPALLRPWRWREPAEAPYLRRRCAAAAFWVAAGLACCGMLAGNVDSGTIEPPALTVLLYNFWGSLILMVDAVAIADGLVLLHNLVARGRRAGRGAATALGSARVRTVLAAVLWVVFIIIGTSSGYYWGGGGLPVVRVLHVPIKGLPDCLEGYRIGMISDVHSGPLVGAETTGWLAGWAAAAQLDVLLLDGDFADGKPELAKSLSGRSSSRSPRWPPRAPLAVGETVIILC